MGRPIKLTSDLQARIVAFLGAGAYVETAASAAGVSKQTLYNWLKRGADGEEPFDGFLDAVERAQGEADIRDLKTIRDAATGGVWQAAAWRLERRHPEKWGRRRVEMTGADGGPVSLDVKSLTLVEIVSEIAHDGDGFRDGGGLHGGESAARGKVPTTSAVGGVGAA